MPAKKGGKRPAKRAAKKITKPREKPLWKADEIAQHFQRPITRIKTLLQSMLGRMTSSDPARPLAQEALGIADAIDARFKQHPDSGKGHLLSTHILTQHGDQVGELVDIPQDPPEP